MECNRYEQEKMELNELFLLDCSELRENLSCDFTGVALQQQIGIDVNWPFVCGNRNEKYKHLLVRYGKGIAGKVIASGSPMTINSFPENILGKTTDYPIMIAEKLISAYAVPLFWEGKPKGALLIGYRSKHNFTTEEINTVRDGAKKVEALLPSYFCSN
ncbi:GAF domain-containing protein [Salirhabdus euzebyi]|uniref:GAF domain-containing protein n=1 Tax=Salirhabdus euzebyi TaxID=394506 RepID=A0A841Q6Q3_9BACI|nr:GAF domain-containing protein [Salirhabdus euzebyi]MBB6454033.1 GAF domain-containing protein [Salirhabdus euzebyi]